MANETINQLANLMHVPVGRLLSELTNAGMTFSDPEQVVTTADKVKLLGYLRRSARTSTETEQHNELLAPSERLDDEDVDVEIEVDEDDLVIDRPFDPERIKVRTVSRTVDLVMRRIDHKEIDLAPEFQRRARVWDIKRKSRLIESLLLKIPLPVFYVAADDQENWSVVDGLQRITTIYDFLRGQYALSGMEYLTRLNEKHFSGLPRPIQRRIEETEFVIHVIESGTPEAVMINIFKRINTGGVSLNGQEIRNALNKGPAREFLRQLAGMQNFLVATDNTVSDARMDAQECALRFAAFMLNDWRDYQTNDLDGFLSRSMRQINELDREGRANLAAQFGSAMLAAHRIFGRFAFRKIYDVNATRRYPVSKALFETWSVCLAKRTDAEISALIKKASLIRSDFAGLMNSSRLFELSVSVSTGVPQRVRERFSAVEDIINRSVA